MGQDMGKMTDSSMALYQELMKNMVHTTAEGMNRSQQPRQSKKRREHQVSFVNKSFQEYFAAYYLVEGDSKDDIIKVVKMCSEFTTFLDYLDLLRFCCGLKPDKGNHIMQQIMRLMVHDPEFKSICTPPASQMRTLTYSVYELLKEYQDVKKANFPLPALVVLHDHVDAEKEMKLMEEFLQSSEEVCTFLQVVSVEKVNKLRPMLIRLMTDCSNLMSLTLHGTNIQMDIALLTRIITENKKLREFGLVSCNLTEQNISLFVKSLEGESNSSKIRSLDLSSNDFNAGPDLAALIKLLPKLQKLWCQNCRITTEGLALMGRSLNSKKLPIEALNFSRHRENGMTGEMAKLLNYMPNIKELDLSHCYDSDVNGVQDFFENLHKWNQLQSLDLSHNNFRDGLGGIIQAPKLTKWTLKLMDLRFNGVSHETEEKIRNVLQAKLPGLDAWLGDFPIM